jgi:hypothetical protein
VGEALGEVERSPTPIHLAGPEGHQADAQLRRHSRREPFAEGLARPTRGVCTAKAPSLCLVLVQIPVRTRGLPGNDQCIDHDRAVRQSHQRVHVDLADRVPEIASERGER